MSFTVKEYQARVNGIFNGPVLVIDGMMGPNTRKGIEDAMKRKNVKTKEELFNRGIRGVVWHWTAGEHGIIELEREHYNFLTDTKGNLYDGKHTIAEQVMYDWQKGVGASHTKSMNTGWIGISQDAMAGAEGWPSLVWGTNPITWEGIDAMLEKTMELCEDYQIPVSRWTTLSHAEVQETLGVPQRNKWDYMVLPGDSKPRNAVLVGDELRKRMVQKYG